MQDSKYGWLVVLGIGVGAWECKHTGGKNHDKYFIPHHYDSTITIDSIRYVD